MLSQKITTQITLVAYATVSNLFAAFHNPKNKGENFAWEKFPDIAAGIVGDQVFLSVVCKSTDEAIKFGKEVGRKIAETMVERMLE